MSSGTDSKLAKAKADIAEMAEARADLWERATVAEAKLAQAVDDERRKQIRQIQKRRQRFARSAARGETP